jgi:hypothetical protein
MTKFQIPSVADVPTVAAERAKLFELQTKLADAKAQIEHATAGEEDATARTAFELAVDRELGREVAVAPAIKLDEAEAFQRFRVLSVAVDRQARIVSAAEHAAAVEIANAAKPEYQSIMRKLQAAVLPLRDALADEQAFRARAYEAGISLSTLGTCPLRGISDAGIECWLSELASKHNI